jgi:DeoR family deoxyribose operon repressor
VDKRSDRLTKIINTLKLNNGMSIRDLADKLGVSHMTVRRDLSLLEEESTVKLMHGAAVLNPAGRIAGTVRPYTLSSEGARQTDEKRRIGEKAASLIVEGDVIVIDSGSTTEHLARSLPDPLGMTVLCYALNILVEVYRKRECRLIFAGGYFHDNTLMFESSEGVDLIRQNRATKAFISASGISEKLGVTCGNPYEVDTKKAVMASSLTKILLADSSKLGKIHAAYFADLAEFDMLITDTGLSAEFQEMLQSRQIEVMVV